MKGYTSPQWAAAKQNRAPGFELACTSEANLKARRGGVQANNPLNIQ